MRTCVRSFYNKLLPSLSILQFNTQSIPPILHKSCYNTHSSPARFYSIRPQFKIMEQPEGEEGKTEVSRKETTTPPVVEQNQSEIIDQQTKEPTNIFHEILNGAPTSSTTVDTIDQNEPPSSPNKSEHDSSKSDDVLSESDWRPPQAQAMKWAHDQMIAGSNPRDLLAQVAPGLTNSIPVDMPVAALWGLLVDMLADPAKRDKLDEHNTLEDSVNLILAAKRIIVLTGAGVSVSCGIPDFRSKDGIYRRLHSDFPDLPDPQAMFDIHYFRRNPRPFFDFAKEIYPGQFEPSKFHKFIRLLEEKGKLLRNYTQNIDTLEQVANIKSVLQCHGSFASATCYNCKHQVDADFIRDDIMNQRIPICPECTRDDGGKSVEERLATNFPVLKPDIVFFGENLPQLFHELIIQDKDEVDLLIVAGSSLKVRPVALIPDSIPTNVPQIVLDRSQLRHMNFDIELLGNCDELAEDLCLRLAQKDPENHQFWTRFCDKKETAELAKLPDWTQYYERYMEKINSVKCFEPSEPPEKRAKLDPENLVEDKNSDEVEGRQKEQSETLTEASVVDKVQEKVESVANEKTTGLEAEPPKEEVVDDKPHRYIDVAEQLPNNNSYFFIPPCTYVFHGAEIYQDLEDYDDCSSDSSTASSVQGNVEILEVDLASGDSDSNDSVKIIEASAYVKQKSPTSTKEDSVVSEKNEQK